MGYDPLSVNAEQFTSVYIINELNPDTIYSMRLKLAQEVAKLKILNPSNISIDEVKKAACITGDLAVLSKADLDVLAIALDISKMNF